jgi:hypothetical protein
MTKFELLVMTAFHYFLLNFVYLLDGKKANEAAESFKRLATLVLTSQNWFFAKVCNHRAIYPIIYRLLHQQNQQK